MLFLVFYHKLMGKLPMKSVVAQQLNVMKKFETNNGYF